MTKSEQLLLMELANIDPDLLRFLAPPSEPKSRPIIRRIKLEVQEISKHKGTFKTIIRRRRNGKQSISPDHD